ncbi:hypothetical protein E3Q10_04384 [Wallemia mellicola]|uniref:Myb-like domain-containing protein n=1 Tax=Wallemia mellicola TaxID=1708541 RepID=A0A4T0PBF3_9BASI|nr:hypothetical protein E3Q14_04411 [Wallemia mellicola]TIC23096.1 hypothetical protein E3Q10_04384 [Wallemia mellicola]
MSGRINKGTTKFQAKVGNRKPRKVAQQPTPASTQENATAAENSELNKTSADTVNNRKDVPPTPPVTQENNKRAAVENTEEAAPAQKKQAVAIGIATPEPSQQSKQSQQKNAPLPVMPGRSAQPLSFNQRFQQSQQSHQPLNTRASQSAPTARPLTTRAAHAPLQTRASQAVASTSTEASTPAAPANPEEKHVKEKNDKGDSPEDEGVDQLSTPGGSPQNKKLSARQLRTQKLKMKRRPIEEIWSEDPTAEPIDTSTFKMADLIHDPGVGRLSSRVVDVAKKHAEMKLRRREQKAKLKYMTEEELNLDGGDDGTGRRRTAEDEERIKKEQEEAKRKKKEDRKAEKKRLKEQKKAEEGVEEGAEEVEGDQEEESSSSDDDDDDEKEQQGPQMRVVDGQLVVDEQSLLYDRSANSRNDTSGYEVTDELDSDRFVNTNTWRGRGRGSHDRWTRLETEMFYDALSRFGTDFEMIATLFKGRTRRVIKAKFTREEKYNSDLITYALKNRKPFDMIEYGKFIGVDFSGPPPEIRVPAPVTDSAVKKDEVVDGEEEVVNPDEEHRGRRPSLSGASAKRKQSRGPGGRDPENEEGAEVVGIVDEGGLVTAAQ